MRITVKLFATLREYGQNLMEMDVPVSSNPESIIQSLKIPKKDVAVLMLNGRSVNFDEELSDGDVLALFPPIGGG